MCNFIMLNCCLCCYLRLLHLLTVHLPHMPARQRSRVDEKEAEKCAGASGRPANRHSFALVVLGYLLNCPFNLDLQFFTIFPQTQLSAHIDYDTSVAVCLIIMVVIGCVYFCSVNCSHPCFINMDQFCITIYYFLKQFSS